MNDFQGKAVWSESEAGLGTTSIRGYRSWDLVNFAMLGAVESEFRVEGTIGRIGSHKGSIGVYWSSTSRRKHRRILANPASSSRTLLTPIGVGAGVIQKDGTIDDHAWKRVEHAICRIPGGTLIRPHTSPDPQCTCGIYAWFRPEETITQHNGPVTGVIAAQGDVLLGSRGMRAGIAEIIAVAPNERWHSMTRSMHRDVLLTLTRGLSGSGITVLGSARELAERYPPDMGTLTNLLGEEAVRKLTGGAVITLGGAGENGAVTLTITIGSTSVRIAEKTRAVARALMPRKKGM